MARILIIDDEPQIRKMMRRMFENEGHDVLEAQNGSVGVQTQQKTPADVVITDIIMPEKEGIETIRDLRREFPKLKIVAMSGGGRINSKSYLSLAEKLGASRTFCKPIEKKKLLSIVQELLEN